VGGGVAQIKGLKKSPGDPVTKKIGVQNTKLQTLRGSLFPTKMACTEEIKASMVLKKKWFGDLTMPKKILRETMYSKHEALSGPNPS